MVVTTAISVLAGYAIARFGFGGRQTFLLAATAIFAFVSSWSELLFALTFTTQTEMRTLSAGLLFMVGQYGIQWGQLSAGIMISTVPVAVLFVFLQRHLIRGLTAGALKG
jgi:ABC-type glycerol-3-phosphate transport system permease component